MSFDDFGFETYDNGVLPGTPKRPFYTNDAPRRIITLPPVTLNAYDKVMVLPQDRNRLLYIIMNNNGTAGNAFWVGDMNVDNARGERCAGNFGRVVGAGYCNEVYIYNPNGFVITASIAIVVPL